MVLTEEDIAVIRAIIQEEVSGEVALDRLSRQVWSTALPLTNLFPGATLYPSNTLKPTGG